MQGMGAPAAAPTSTPGPAPPHALASQVVGYVAIGIYTGSILHPLPALFFESIPIWDQCFVVDPLSFFVWGRSLSLVVAGPVLLTFDLLAIARFRQTRKFFPEMRVRGSGVVVPVEGVTLAGTEHGLVRGPSLSRSRSTAGHRSSRHTAGHDTEREARSSGLPTQGKTVPQASASAETKPGGSMATFHGQTPGSSASRGRSLPPNPSPATRYRSSQGSNSKPGTSRASSVSTLESFGSGEVQRAVFYSQADPSSLCRCACCKSCVQGSQRWLLCNRFIFSSLLVLFFAVIDTVGNAEVITMSLRYSTFSEAIDANDLPSNIDQFRNGRGELIVTRSLVFPAIVLVTFGTERLFRRSLLRFLRCQTREDSREARRSRRRRKARLAAQKAKKQRVVQHSQVSGTLNDSATPSQVPRVSSPRQAPGTASESVANQGVAEAAPPR